MRTYLLFHSYSCRSIVLGALLIASTFFAASSVNGQCQPVFDSSIDDPIVSCGQEVPVFGACSATSDCCDGPVAVTSFTSETGGLLHDCILSTAFGPGPDWAIWLPMIPAPSVSWNFVGDGHFQQYADGTAHVWGLVANSVDPSLQLEAEFWLHAGADWSQWSAMGRSYKNDLGFAGTNYVNWTYYELVPIFSRLTGTGSLEGTVLELHHQPADYFYGFQTGVGANNRNGNEGLSGWFTYDGTYNNEEVSGHGDLNVNQTCEDITPGCASTAWTQICRAEDSCGNVAFQTQTISVVDDVAPVVDEFADLITIPCDASDSTYITASDACSSVTITYTDEIITPGCGGQLIRHYLVSDACGNSVLVEQTINLMSLGELEFTVFPEDINIDCDQFESLDPQVEWTEACANTELTISQNIIEGDCPANYTVEYTYTLTDACGNEVSQVWTVVVLDDAKPVLLDIPAGITISCGEQIPPALPFALDNCSEVNVSLEAVTVAEECGYNFIRTWTATDACGNSQSASQTIYVSDSVDPFFTFLPSDVTIECGEPFELDMALAEDQCSNVDLAWTDVPLGDCGGSYLRLWRAYDGCGNQALEATLVTVVDIQAPVMTMFPEDVEVNCGAVPSVESVDVQYTDNCGAVTVAFSETTSDGDCAGGYIIHRTWTLTDGCGNSSDWTWNINVSDTQAPQLVGVPEDISVSCGDEISDAVVVGIDNCDAEVLVSLEASTEPGDCGYLFIRTWTAIDGCGNTTSASQVITVNDELPPVFTFVPEDVNLSCGLGVTLEDLPIAEATDDCSIVTVTFEDSPIGESCDAGLLRTFTATDGCGNVTTAEQLISFSDNEPPVFTFVPEDITAQCGDDTAILTLPVAEATDNCSSATVNFVDTPGEGCGGSFVRVYTATDGCGNTATASVVVTLIDNEAPQVTFAPADVTVDCGNVPTVEGNGIQYTDNCGAVTAELTENTITSDVCPGSYEIVRTWTLTDDCGNESTYVWNILVTDNTPPQLIGVPADAEMSCGDEISDAVVVALDNCDADVQVSLEANTVSTDCGYQFVRTWSATDACGNTVSASQTITVQDNNPPVFTFVPADLNITCNGGNTDPLETATATDDCSSVTVSFNDEFSSGGCAGGFIRHWVATDGCGNSVTADQEIISNDQSAPVITNFPTDITVSCSEVPTVESAGVEYSDDCGSVLSVVDESSIAGDCPNEYILSRTWTITDACGNSVDSTWTIFVVDEEGPVVFGVPENKTIGCGTPIEDVVVTAIDNCSAPENIIIALQAKTLDTDCGTIFVRTWTVTDECGNSIIVSQEITIMDMEAPVFTFVPEDIFVGCGEAYELLDPIATDDCSNFTVTSEIVSQDCINGITRLFTATDACGHVTTAQQIIHINDENPPVPSQVPPAFQSFLCTEHLDVDANYITFTDDCSEVTVVFEESLLPTDCPGSYSMVYTWLATDACGNSDFETMEVLYVDQTAPEFTQLPEDLILSCGEAIPAFDVVATDDCSEIFIETSDETLPSDCGYQVVRTITATDECGNFNQYLQLITFVDDAAPVFNSLPADIFLSCTESVPDVVIPGATDACSDVVNVDYTESIIPGNCPNSYTIVRVFLATDGCNNLAEHTQSIFVNDNEGPVFVDFVSEITVQCTESNGVFATAQDDCSSMSITYTDELTGTSCGGAIIRTYHAEDACGNVTTAEQIINLTDSQSPEFITFPVDGTMSCSDVPSVDQVVIEYTDNCSAVTVDFSEAVTDGDCPNSYHLERTWVISDACGNSTSRTWVLEVQDNDAPLILGVPADETIDCGDVIPAVAVFAFDNCTAEPLITLEATQEQIGCNTMFTRRWTAIDECGNLSQEIQVITITDFYNPSLSEYPADIVLACGEAVPDAPAIFATDNCVANIDVTFTEDIVGAGACPTIQRTWCATDCVGNEECHTQTISFQNNGGTIQNGALIKAWQQSASNAQIIVTANSDNKWQLDVYDINGKLIVPLFAGDMKDKETRMFNLDINSFGDSMYFVRFTDGETRVTQGIAVVR